MVKVFLRGGLGNQMFEYAAGLAVAEKNRSELALDTTFLLDRWPRRNFTYRALELGIFALEPRFTPLSRLAARLPLPGIWLGLDLLGLRLREKLGWEKVIREKNREFEPNILDAKGNITLYGFWQDERYFRDIAPRVRSAFAFREPLSSSAGGIAGEMAECESVSLHVRRGDFAAFKNVEKLMGGTDLDYYARALKRVSELTRNPKIFVFSDDLEWCRENLSIDQPTVYVPPALGGPGGSGHMRLMSLAKHNIIANSTFSWWGAWLNANPGKIVIAPKHWYADGTRTEIVPESWTKL